MQADAEMRQLKQWEQNGYTSYAIKMCLGAASEGDLAADSATFSVILQGCRVGKMEVSVAAG